jgi:CBS domain-containing protein
MAVSQICRREVDLVDPDESAWNAAERMLRRAVGSLIVLDQERRPIGIVTDRDLVTKVMAPEKSPRMTRVRDIMTTPVTIVSHTTSIVRAFKVMRGGEVRYLPVVDNIGKLVGILTLDDLLAHISRELGGMDQIVGS